VALSRAHRPGTIIALYLIVSSVLRFVIEFFRYHDQALPFGLPLSLTQWISLGLIVCSGGLDAAECCRTAEAQRDRSTRGLS
jgi:prolipoprotein diacylglyceryltransferase